MTNLVRVSAYVDPDLARLIDETADALGMRSRSAMVAEVLANSAPVLEVLRDMGRSLQEAPDRHRTALATLADGLRPLVEDARLGLDSIGPPTSNTGVRK